MHSGGPRTAAYALACLMSLAIASDLLWMPIQVADSLDEIVDASHSSSVVASFRASVGTEAYLRPMRIAQIKALFDVAQDRYWLVYRGFHALLLVAAVLLFTRALQVSTWTDFAAASFGLVVFIGLHTFRGTLFEAFPINHFLQIVVFCLVAVNLAQSRGGLWVDAAAALTLLVAALTLESGLLVWVVAAAAWASGWRGISRRGLAIMTAILAGYLYYRFVHLSTGIPALSERSTGYLFETLDPPELQRRFGEQPLWFYAYNVVTSVVSVLAAEPQAGVFVAVRAWLDDRLLPRLFLPVATSLATTVLLLWGAVRYAAVSRHLVIFAAVLLANAALSFAYTKNEIMSPAGAFYGLAAFAVAGELLRRTATAHVAVRLTAALLLCILATGWSIRTLGLHYGLRSQAIKHQVDWADLPNEWQRSGAWPANEADQRLILQLRREAIDLELPNTRLDRPEWVSRLWTD
jgi:hypothetical protein